MVSEFERKHHEVLAGLISHVLRCREGLIRVPDLAQQTGFSRFHLARLFRQVTNETLEGFVRRIRLERSGYMLLNTQSPIDVIAAECGYSNPESFCRAFKAAYGSPPSKFRNEIRSWWLPAPTGLHWKEHYGSANPALLPGYVDMEYHYRSKLDVAVWTWIGNYAKLEDGWINLAERLEGNVPKGKTFVTIYRNNLWTHPIATSMRSELGWILKPNEDIPRFMTRITLPKGLYEMTSKLVLRPDRSDAWSYVSTTEHPDAMAFDEYPAWPLPFDNVLTRIVRGPVDSRLANWA